MKLSIRKKWKIYTTVGTVFVSLILTQVLKRVIWTSMMITNIDSICIIKISWNQVSIPSLISGPVSDDKVSAKKFRERRLPSSCSVLKPEQVEQKVCEFDYEAFASSNNCEIEYCAFYYTCLKTEKVISARKKCENSFIQLCRPDLSISENWSSTNFRIIRLLTLNKTELLWFIFHFIIIIRQSYGTELYNYFLYHFMHYNFRSIWNKRDVFILQY